MGKQVGNYESWNSPGMMALGGNMKERGPESENRSRDAEGGQKANICLANIDSLKLFQPVV